jgi:GTPase SAR1 family protein
MASNQSTCFESPKLDGSIICEENYKMILVGDSDVGKTSLLCRYINNQFNESTKSTVGVDYRSKSSYVDGR